METEKELYTRIWKSGKYGSSGTVGKAYNSLVDIDGSILDVGCGKGDFVARMRHARVEVYGCDITLAGIAHDLPGIFTEVPSIATMYQDDKFDHVVSMDFLEHLPEEEVRPTLEEFKRISTDTNYHWICCRPDVMGAKYGAVLHKTVKPMTWWRGEFLEAGFKSDEFELIEAS